MVMSLPYALDLIGTFVFALSGAMAGVKQQARYLWRPGAVFRGSEHGRESVVMS